MKYLLIIFLFAPCSLLAQDKSFKDFLSLFPKKKLPFCVNYEDSGFVEYLEIHDGDTCVGREGVNIIDFANDLPFTKCRYYLWSDSEKRVYNPEEFGWKNIDTSLYYSIGLFKETEQFCLLVYGEKPFRDSYEEQYLCTISPNGKLISKILIGEAGPRGHGICKYNDDGTWEGYSWYDSGVESCIRKELIANIKSTITGVDTGDYVIDSNGNIIKQPPVNK